MRISSYLTPNLSKTRQSWGHHLFKKEICETTRCYELWRRGIPGYNPNLSLSKDIIKKHMQRTTRYNPDILLEVFAKYKRIRSN
jgi:hypothetical protein